VQLCPVELRASAIRWVGLALTLYACGAPDAATDQADAATSRADSDSDWLCDETEGRAGTDPTLVDTDGDRVPDGIEVQYGLDPLDAADPGLSGLVVLSAMPGAMTDFVLYAVVDGDGTSFAGELEAWPSFDPSWATAERYFSGAIATSAEPPDHVFGFPDNGDRIGSVVGETRLGFRLRFRFGQDIAAPCAQAVAFSYAIKRQDGARFGDRRYILIIAPDPADIRWCAAQTCL